MNRKKAEELLAFHGFSTLFLWLIISRAHLNLASCEKALLHRFVSHRDRYRKCIWSPVLLSGPAESWTSRWLPARGLKMKSVFSFHCKRFLLETIFTLQTSSRKKEICEDFCWSNGWRIIFQRWSYLFVKRQLVSFVRDPKFPSFFSGNDEKR